jgi:Domain of unknown function (DUF4070)
VIRVKSGILFHGELRTLGELRKWPPVLPVFGQITPFSATPLYDRLMKEGRLTRPQHWLEFAPFLMAHKPKGMTAAEVQSEVHNAWDHAYSPSATVEALDAIGDQPMPCKDQPLGCPHLLPRHLLSTEICVGLAQGDRAESRFNLPQ